MRIQYRALLIIFLALSLQVKAQDVYRCRAEDGTPTFGDTPEGCYGPPERIAVGPFNSTPGPSIMELNSTMLAAASRRASRQRSFGPVINTGFEDRMASREARMTQPKTRVYVYRHRWWGRHTR